MAQPAILDANEAAADVAYRTAEVITLYPITPASPMGEYADAWSAKGRLNLWATVPSVVEMQSEAGAAGALHGALQGGALATTFTASQGLLLMLPDMFKIAGELTPVVLHVAARSLATHALSIFGDHSDVYAARSTGFAMLCSRTPQEAHDLAAVSMAATLESRIPFLHFFDGFRTSHELNRVEKLSDEDLLAMVSEEAIARHRARSLSPDRPVVRGTAQNPDTFFQAREACNPFYDACAEKVEAAFEALAARTGRRYNPFEYFGAPDADRVVVLMGSGALCAEETAAWLNARGEKVGVVSVRLFRPFSSERLSAVIPETVKTVVVLDRAKEPGAPGEPLFLDVLCALRDRSLKILGGRFGLSSKEFTPAMCKAVFDEAAAGTLRQGFTIGINDDITHRSIPWDNEFDLEPDDVVRAVFYGLGSDGTVGANKNSAQILGEDGDRHAQGYFVYDSKKAGAVTISHLRFGPREIRSSYLIRRANFVACHQWPFLERLDVLSIAAQGATVLLNAPMPADRVWNHLPVEVQKQILDKQLKVYVIDAQKVANEAGGARRMNPVNTVMQVCFFALSGVLPRDEAIDRIRRKIQKSYGGKGDEVVRVNLDAVDAALSHMEPLPIPEGAPASRFRRRPAVPVEAPDFIQRVTAMMIAGQGDLLPVSAFPPDGTWPVSTTRWEKRNIALEIPVWDTAICIQCNKCALICPHAAIRAQVFDAQLAATVTETPATFKSTPFKGKEMGEGLSYALQVAPEDCTGCGLCVAFCPAKDKKNPRHKAIDMMPQEPLRVAENENFAHFLTLPDVPREKVPETLKGSQFLRPLFEFSGACAGCGETPYIKLITQLFGDRTVISNATGCSSIYGGNLPTTPYCTDASGRGPAWVNSLFEDNAEMGLGVRLGLDQRAHLVRTDLAREAGRLGLPENLVTGLLDTQGRTEHDISEQRARVAALKTALAPFQGKGDHAAARILALSDDLVRKVVWIVGGDGWAYDIGYGGLDHVLASGADVNLIVLDTEVYSNTGGQASKSTPKGAVAKFAADGKSGSKKNLGLLAIMHGHVYVAQVAMGAKDAHTHKAMVEAESWGGPSIIIAYSPCIAHGYDLVHGPDQEKLAVETGYWPLYRYDPRRKAEGKPALVLDSGPPTTPLGRFTQNETRFQMLVRAKPERAQALLNEAQDEVRTRYELLARLAGGAATE